MVRGAIIREPLVLARGRKVERSSTQVLRVIAGTLYDERMLDICTIMRGSVRFQTNVYMPW